MRTPNKCKYVILGALLWLLAACPGTLVLQAGDEVPYRGSTTGGVTLFAPVLDEYGEYVTALYLETTADEISLHGGRGYQDTELTITFPGGIATANGTTDAVTANGDLIYISFTITSKDFTGPFPVEYLLDFTEPLTFSGTFTVTGGTGRFEGATGSGELWGVADLAAGTWNGAFDGVISSPGSLKSKKGAGH